MEIEEAMTSCGYSVPLLDFVGQRETLVKWAERKGEAGIEDYWRKKNMLSFDGTATGVLDD
jgi:hypothetical protein